MNVDDVVSVAENVRNIYFAGLNMSVLKGNRHLFGDNGKCRTYKVMAPIPN